VVVARAYVLNINRYGLNNNFFKKNPKKDIKEDHYHSASVNSNNFLLIFSDLILFPQLPNPNDEYDNWAMEKKTAC
jgi:hypothetical protein